MLLDFSFGIHPYGVMIAIGLILCFIVLWFMGRKDKIDPKFMNFVETDAICAIVLGFGSAVLFQSVYDYIENPSAGFHINSGMTFIGGLIGGAAVFVGLYFIIGRKHKSKLIDVLPYLPCAVLIAHAFGRLGCFFGGCCYGREALDTDLFKFLAIPYGGYGTTSVKMRYSTQLMESSFLFIMFGVTFFLHYKYSFKYNMPLYVGCYGIFRFLIEFLRDDYRGSFVGGVTPSQFWSLAMIVFSVLLFFLLRYLYQRREKNTPKEELKTVE